MVFLAGENGENITVFSSKDDHSRVDFRKKRHVYLIGFMGAGKSTVGRLLARELGRRWVDMDMVIVREARQTIADIFSREGEAGFRRRETKLLARLAKESSPLVVSTGGGIILAKENRELLRRSGIIIYLEVPFAHIWSRLTQVSKGSDRPLFATNREEEVRERFHERESLYREVADLIYPNLNTPEEAASHLARELRRFWR